LGLGREVFDAFFGEGSAATGATEKWGGHRAIEIVGAATPQKVWVATE
jgi:hypothetical protein